MTQTVIRRYVFMEYNLLSWETIKKLEKISSKIFVFVPTQVENIPFDVIQATQKMGKRLKWLCADISESDFLSSHVAFILGKWHERSPVDIEFAIVSDTDVYDNFVVLLNNLGRKCLRIHIQNTELKDGGKDWQGENEDNDTTDSTFQMHPTAIKSSVI